MQTIPKVKDLGKRQRDKILALNPRFLTSIAESLKPPKTVATVSRVFSGDIKYSPEVEMALNKGLEKLDWERIDAA